MRYFSILPLSFLYATASWATTYDDATCDSVCNQIVDPTSDQMINLEGNTSGWSSTDDAWCAANPFSLSSPPSTSSAATQENRCQYHNSQVLTYCIAYDKTQKATGMELPLLVLDAAGAGICGTVCLTPMVSAPMYMGCRLDSTAASAMDVLDSLILDSDTLSRSITAVMGAAGLASNYMELKDVGNLKQFFAGDDGTDDMKAKHNACITAAVLAAGAGMRAYEISSQQQSKQSACGDIKNLLSTSPVIAAASPTPSGNAVTSPIGSVGGLTGPTSIGTVSALGSSSLINLGAAVSCAQNGLASCNYMAGNMAAASDGGLLGSSGLDQVAAQQLANSNLSGISQTAPDAGSMVSHALGDRSSDVATKIAEVAKVAQQNGAKLAKSDPLAASGGASLEAKSVAGAGGFNFESQSAGANSGEMKFDRSPASAGSSADIWHENYKGSIFQIVSNKISQTKERLAPLEWVTPLNRALMGLPSSHQNPPVGGLK